MRVVQVFGRSTRSLEEAPDGRGVLVVDQTRLPFAFERVRVDTLAGAADAISRMVVRGAPLIGVTAAYGLALALAADPSDTGLSAAVATLAATRPTAVNLRWALERVRARAVAAAPSARFDVAWREARAIAEEDVAMCARIGEHGLALLRDVAARSSGAPIRLLTHCNAGWLAAVDWGTALAPIYRAYDEGLPVHVFADETRPRNQGASLTAWELAAHGVPVTLVADNAAGHLLQRGEIDACIVGADRVTRRGDVANKIGTYLKALAARAHGVPFWVALPASTIDWTLDDGARIPIEERSEDEVLRVAGRAEDGRVVRVAVAPPGVRARNPAFDVTPAALVTALVTERGSCAASEEGLLSLYPERRPA
jgi:methylthioribose-1-phosphate isomerase